jgi:integrase/recombinase XerD
MNANEIIDEFQSRQEIKKNGGTGRRYADLVRKFVIWLNDDREKGWNNAETVDVRVWLRGLLEDGHAPSTITTAESAISQFYQELVEMYEEDFDIQRPPNNPIEDLDITDWKALKAGTLKSQKLKEDRHYLSPGEVQKLADSVNEPAPRNRLLILLSYQTGCRNGEIRKIRLDDIDLNERSIQIRGDKTNENRVVYYQPSLDDALRLWIDIERNTVTSADYAEIDTDMDTIECNGKSNYLFPTQRKEYISSRQLNRIVSEAAWNAGLQEELYVDNHKNPRTRLKTTHHSLRHSFAMAAINPDVGGGKMDVRSLQKLLGHNDIDTTMTYLQMDDDDLAISARRYGAGTEQVEKPQY